MDQNLVLIAGVALAGGVLIGFLLGNLKSKDAGTRARDAEAELEAYRKQVADHFGQTAEHFQALGQQYKSLYEHLAAGADSLCDTPDAGSELSFVPSGMLAQQTSELASEADVPETAVPQDAVEAAEAAEDSAAVAQSEEPAEKLSAEAAAAEPDANSDDEPPADQSVGQPEKLAADEGDNADAPKVTAERDEKSASQPIYH